VWFHEIQFLVLILELEVSIIWKVVVKLKWTLRFEKVVVFLRFEVINLKNVEIRWLFIVFRLIKMGIFHVRI
jgi:hypothetical protein